jgi:HK97 family phage prohead protease
MKLKTRPAELKAIDVEGDPPGTFEALVSVFNNVDSDGERVLPGAFTNSLAKWKAKGDPIPVIWSHDWSDPRSIIGKAIDARETDEGLLVKAQLRLNSPGSYAAEVYDLLKQRLVTQFSFAYDVVESSHTDEKTDSGWGGHVVDLKELDLFEVGPCLVGVNTDTQLLDVKGAKQGRTISAANEAILRAAMQGIGRVLQSIGGDAVSDDLDSDGDGKSGDRHLSPVGFSVGGQKAPIPSHSTATDDTSDWDANANVTNLSNDAGASTYRQAFAMMYPDRGDEDSKSAYGYPHHNVSSDGKVGAANITACSTGIGALNGGRGGHSLSADDRQAVYNHLARHISDSGRDSEDIPPLKYRRPDGQDRGPDGGPDKGNAGQGRGARESDQLLAQFVRGQLANTQSLLEATEV